MDDWGTIRSLAMALHLRKLNGKSFMLYEALSIGKNNTSEETMKLLNKWADIIIDMSQDGKDFIGEDMWKDINDISLTYRMKELWKSKMKEMKKNV
jgi:hypothetical protein